MFKNIEHAISYYHIIFNLLFAVCVYHELEFFTKLCLIGHKVHWICVPFQDSCMEYKSFVDLETAFSEQHRTGKFHACLWVCLWSMLVVGNHWTNWHYIIVSPQYLGPGHLGHWVKVNVSGKITQILKRIGIVFKFDIEIWSFLYFSLGQSHNNTLTLTSKCLNKLCFWYLFDLLASLSHWVKVTEIK